MDASANSPDRGCNVGNGESSEGFLEGGTHSARLQLLFDNMLEGYAYCCMLFDEQGRPEDFVYVDVNPAFGQLTGLTDVIGKRVTDVIPDIKQSNPELFEIYGRVTKSGEPEQFEVALDQLGMILKISVFRPEPGYFVAVFHDITERKRAEQQVEALLRFLEFRVEQRTNDLAEALRLLDRAPRDEAESGS